MVGSLSLIVTRNTRQVYSKYKNMGFIILIGRSRVNEKEHEYLERDDPKLVFV